MAVELLEFYVTEYERLSGTRFVEKHPDPVLVLSLAEAAGSADSGDSGSWRSFHTAAHSISTLQPGLQVVGGGRPVLRVCKQAQNPWHDRVSVGRARNNDLVLRDDSVSKLHAHFRVQGDQVMLLDTGSRNGTRRNGTPLQTDVEIELNAGDLVKIGRVEGVYHSALSFAEFVRHLIAEGI